MGNTFIKGRGVLLVALVAWFIGGIGGNSPDIDHFLSKVTGNAIPWAFLHCSTTVIVLAGCVIASLGGLVISLVLRK